MSKTIFLLFPLIFAFCKVSKNVQSSSKLTKGTILFTNYFEITENGEKNLQQFLDSLVSTALTLSHDNPDLDSAHIKSYGLGYPIVEQFKYKPTLTVHIEFDEDTIWRYETLDEAIRGNIFSIDAENGILNYHPKGDRHTTVRKVNLFEIAGEYEVIIDYQDKKNILGIECYKVTLKKKEEIDDEIPIDSWDTLYEMYVTEAIDLPVLALLNVTKPFNDFFPLEVKIKESGMPGVYEIFRAIELTP